MEKTLVILAAGMGSRFGRPKQLEPLGPGGHCLLEFLLSDAYQHGYRRAVCVVRESIRDALELRLSAARSALSIDFAIQPLSRAGFPREKPFGSGQALLSAEPFVDSPFLLANADDYYGRRFWRDLETATQSIGEDALLMGFQLGRTLSASGPVSRGICRIENGILRSITEARALVRTGGRIRDSKGSETFAEDTLVSMNLFHFPPKIFGLLRREWDRFLEKKPDPQDEFQLPTAINSLLRCGELCVRVQPTESDWSGLTYESDRAAVERMVSDYPTNLWGK